MTTPRTRRTPPPALAPAAPQPRLRVQVKHGIAIGPGKADLLAAIGEHGSLAQAGRSLGMSYQRAWTLVQALNRDFDPPLVELQRGGAAGGGAVLTANGLAVLRLYRRMEAAATRAVLRHLPALQARMKP